MASNSLRCSRTDPWASGVSTGMDTSVSLLSASLASVHSRRIAATADEHSGVGLVQAVEGLRQPGPDVLEDDLVEVDAAEPLQALRSAGQA